MGINGHIEWWGILVWALLSLLYLSLASYFITGQILDVFLDRFAKAIEFWIKVTANKDKVTPIK